MIIELDKKDHVIRIKSNICLKCGEKFSVAKNKKELYESEHHGIPSKMKPKYKVIIPMHVKCHMKMNSMFLHKSEFIKIEQKVDSLRAAFSRIKNGLDVIEEVEK